MQQAFGLLPRTFCSATTGLVPCCGLSASLAGRRTPPFGQGILPCPTSSDRRRPSASQHRRPRRARWSFPSYSPESLSRHSTIGSRNRRQISSLELLEVTFVVQEGYFAGPVLPEGTLVARRLTLCVPYHRKSLS